MKTHSYDVVVVGGGGSGLAAAVEASDSGASVVVLEKARYLRGSTGRSIGSITAARTPDQKKKGIEDSPEDHLRDYFKISGKHAHREDPELAKLLVYNVTATLAWLRTMGMEFFGPIKEEPHSQPRMHNILPTSRSYIYHMAKRARANGVSVHLDRAAVDLIREGRRVIAVDAQDSSAHRIRYHARNGVVLATGDFSNNPQLKGEYISDAAAAFVAVNEYATGDGQLLAMKLGGEVLLADVVDTPSLRLQPPPTDGLYGLLQRLPPGRWLTAPMKWGMHNLPPQLVKPFVLGFVTTYLSPTVKLFQHGAILVDQTGALRSNTQERIEMVVASLGEAGAYIVGDKCVFDRFSRHPYFVATAPGIAYAYMDDFRRSRKDVFFQAGTLADLARRIRIDPRVLDQSVQRSKEAGGSPPGSVTPTLQSPPYFAMGPVRAYLLQTNGGLRVSTDLEVLTGDGEPIPGLYAAGNAGQGGLALLGHGHHLGWAFTSGRIAGRNAARPASHD